MTEWAAPDNTAKMDVIVGFAKFGGKKVDWKAATLLYGGKKKNVASTHDILEV